MLKIKTFEFAYVGVFSVVAFSRILTELYESGTLFIQGFGHYQPK